MAAEEEHNNANPSEHVESEKKKSGNLGTITDHVINVPEVMEGVDTIMEWKAPDCMDNSSQDLIHLTIGNKEGARVIVQSNGMKEGATHVEDRVCDGPKNSKNRPTWTRLARMVDGQEVSTQQNPVMLGKRGLPQWGEDFAKEEEGHTKKHEKLHGGKIENVVAGVHDHHHRAQ